MRFRGRWGRRAYIIQCSTEAGRQVPVGNPTYLGGPGLFRRLKGLFKGNKAVALGGPSSQSVRVLHDVLNAVYDENSDGLVSLREVDASVRRVTFDVLIPDAASPALVGFVGVGAHIPEEHVPVISARVREFGAEGCIDFEIWLSGIADELEFGDPEYDEDGR